MTLLAHATISASALEQVTVGEGSRTMVFLHGILGSAANWRTFARRLVEAKPGWRAVLVDLRVHGASQDFPPPYTLASCADDLRALENSIGHFDGVIGHSFGGKVALEFVRSRHADARPLDIAWILDSSPGARPDRRGSESTVQIVKMIDTLPERFASREAFVEYVEKQGAERSIAMWLAMNVRAAQDGDGYVMRVNVPALRALLDDYFTRDMWPVLEDGARTTKIHVVAAGNSHVLDNGERALAQRVSVAHPESTWFHVIPNAGHWLHVDQPDALLALIAEYM